MRPSDSARRSMRCWCIQRLMFMRSAFRGRSRSSFPSIPAFSRYRTFAMASQTPDQEASTPTYTPRYIDIGINLTDPIFRGKYRGKQSHPDDLQGVIDRAKQVGCTKLMVTGSTLKESRFALTLAEKFPGITYTTAGIHPCSSSVFSKSKKHAADSEHTIPCDPDPNAPIPDQEPDPSKSASIIADLTTFLGSARSTSPSPLVAFGEFGLDYDRLHYCSKAIQLHSFQAQLKVAASLEPQLPLFLHSRAAHRDFVRLLKEAFGDKLEKLTTGGVVHSFTGTIEEMKELMDLGLYIGINGCSFKTVENCDVVKALRLDRLMLETDGPWCEVRPSHEGYKYLIEKKDQNGAAPEEKAKPKKNQKKESEIFERFKTVKKEKWVEGALVKGRNEPCNIERIAQIVAGIKGVSIEEVCEAAWKNTVKVFGMGEQA